MSEPSSITSAQLPDVEDVRRWMKEMIASLRFVELVAAVIAFVVRMRDLNTELTKRLAELRRGRPRSETLHRVEAQLAMNFAAGLVSAMTTGTSEPVETSAEASSSGPDIAPPNAEPTKGKKKRPSHHGRGSLPAHLRRVDDFNPVPAAMRVCPACGETMKPLPCSVCEILDVQPAELIVRQRRDERLACPNDDTIVSAPTPPEIVERGKLGTTLIVESLGAKYLEHQPIERQCQKWSRTGVEIAPQTLGRAVAAAIDLLAPIAQAIRTVTSGPGLLATDATGLPVLDRDAPDGIRQGTMWCWTNARWVSFVYSAQGDADSVKRFLGEDHRRHVQCDGTSITNFLERAGGQRPGCWSHGRRRLVLAARAGDQIALEGLKKIAALFVVERASAEAGDTSEQRLWRRKEHSAPLIEDLRQWMETQRATAPPRTPLGQALGYLHRQWRRLVLFLTDGQIELTNNRVEREIRKLVLGRRNWLFTWKDLGGERTAAILTIIATCISFGVNPRAYLHLATKLLLGGWPQAKLRDLLPDRLAIAHPTLLVSDDGQPVHGPLLGAPPPVSPAT